MELVRAYVTLGFKEQRSIHPKDVTRIVTRYLNGDSMEKIAKEEAIRIEREGKMIVPKRPIPEFGIQYERQDPDDTLDEHLVRQSLQRWRTGLLLSGALTLAVNIGVGICNLKDIDLSFPIGFLPMPLLIWTIIMGNKRSTELDKLKRIKDNKKLEELLHTARDRGTTTVRR